MSLSECGPIVNAGVFVMVLRNRIMKSVLGATWRKEVGHPEELQGRAIFTTVKRETGTAEGTANNIKVQSHIRGR